MNESIPYLDKPKREYEGAMDEIRRKERERIAAVLETRAALIHNFVTMRAVEDIAEQLRSGTL